MSWVTLVVTCRQYVGRDTIHHPYTSVESVLGTGVPRVRPSPLLEHVLLVFYVTLYSVRLTSTFSVPCISLSVIKRQGDSSFYFPSDYVIPTFVNEN